GDRGSGWAEVTRAVGRLIRSGSISAYAIVLMLVNCSERKKPPTKSRIIISAMGVAAVKPAHTARKAALTTELTTRTLRKPKRRKIIVTAHFIPMAPSAVANVIMP